MGLCCCKIYDDDDVEDRNEAAPQGRSTHVRPPPLTTSVQQRQRQSRNSRQQTRVLQVVTPQPTTGIINNDNRIGDISDAQGATQRITKDDDLVLALIKALPVRHHTMYIPPNKGPHTLECLDANSSRFLRIKLFSHKKFNENYEIHQEFRVWNPFLMAQYAMNKKKYEKKYKERHLFHGTGHGAATGIIAHNFDWRKTKESWYGQGVYFAKNPYYAALYSLKRQNSIIKNNYVMIVAKVLVELEEDDISKGYSNTVVPEEGHTTVSKHGHELIKYEDACFYPEFIVFFHPKC